MQQYGNSRNPDDTLVVTFRHHPVPNEHKTAEEGRPIFDDMEVCDIRPAGSRNFATQPAHMRARWVSDDPYGGEQRQETYAERFQRQYRQFKEKLQQTISGTPLEHAPFLTEARRSELRALNIYTVEQLAAIDGQELKNLGQYGRDQKNRAMEWIAESKAAAPGTTQLVAQLEAERARNQTLQDDNEALKSRVSTAELEFDGMTDEALRKLIQTNTGHAPQGLLPRKMLIRMAMEARPNKVA